MVLKNYTTSISVEKTMMEIEKILASHGASHIFKMYNDDHQPMALAFKASINGQLISFKLPMEEDKILRVFQIEVNKGKLPKKYYSDKDQARRTGWRIIKDWVVAQMALIEIHVVKFEEIFLPYIYDEVNNKTLFEKLENNNFQISYQGDD